MNDSPALADARQALLAMVGNASRHVDIQSPNLEPTLLNDAELVRALTLLARRGRQTRIRLLVRDLTSILKTGHQLLALARRLRTALECRVLLEHPEWTEETLVLIDRRNGLMARLSDHRIETLDSPAVAQQRAETFDRLWRSAERSPELQEF